MNNKRYLAELDMIRGVAILAVLFIHSVSTAFLHLAVSSAIYGPYLFISRSVSFAVPVFLSLSGFVTFYTYASRPLTKRLLQDYYLKRFRYILIPYLLFSVFFFVLRLVLIAGGLPDRFPLGEFIKVLMTGSAYNHLYFIFVMMQYFVLFPLLLLLARTRLLRSLIVVIGLVLQIGYTFINRQFIVGRTDIPEILHKTGSLFPSYLAYFLLGAYLALHADRILDLLQSRSKRLFACLLLLYGTWIESGLAYDISNYRLNKGYAVPSAWFEYSWLIYNMASFLVLLHGAHWIYKRYARVSSIFISLGKNSFGMYMIHLIILLFYRKIAPSGQPFLFTIYYIVGYVLTAGLSWLIVSYISRTFAWSWLLFGSSARKQHKVESSAEAVLTTSA